MADNTFAHEQDLLKLYIDEPSRIDPSDNPFASDEAKAIYSALCDLHAHGASFNVRNLARAIKDYDTSVTVTALTDLMSHDADQESFDYYLARIREEALKIDLEEQLKEFRRGVVRKGKLDFSSLRESLGKLESSVDEFSEHSRLETASDFVHDFYEDVQLRIQGKSFYPTGDRLMDSLMTYGFAPGSMTTLFSASGLGKTQFKLHILNQRINLMQPTLSVELEMENAPLAERLVCMRKQIKYSRFHPKAALMTDGDPIEPHLVKAVQEEERKLRKNKHFYNVNEASLAISDLTSLIKEAKKRMGSDYLAVFIDLTTMLRDFNEGGGMSTADRYQQAVDKLHVLTRSENIHVFNIVQANREFVTAKLKKPEDVYSIVPQPRHVKNSSAFEERSRTLIGLNRPKYFLEQLFPDSPENEIEENILEAVFLKQNGGPLGSLKYLYVPETYTLARWIPPEQDSRHAS